VQRHCHGNKRPFWIQLRGPHNVHLDFLLCPRILENEFCSCFETLAKNDHVVGGADSVGGPFDEFVSDLQVNSGIREMAPVFG